jgi:hypothetical protein
VSHYKFLSRDLIGTVIIADRIRSYSLGWKQELKTKSISDAGVKIYKKVILDNSADINLCAVHVGT